MKPSSLLTMVQAAQEPTLLSSALAYYALGLSVIPLEGKRPNLKSWIQFQQKAALPEEIQAWSRAGLLRNIGVVCGAVSSNLVILDFDDFAGYTSFVSKFPRFAKTYSVASGGGVGRHVYFYVDRLPQSIKAMNTPIGHLEVCSTGRQVVMPPSIHPTTRRPYRVEYALEVLHVPDLVDVVAWVESFKPRQAMREWKPPNQITYPAWDTALNPRILEEIARVLVRRGFKQYGDWLHGSCIHPKRHKNGDRNPSFSTHKPDTGIVTCAVRCWQKRFAKPSTST